MRRLIFITLILIMILASSCKAKDVVGVDNTPETPKPVQTEEQNKPVKESKEGRMDLAFEGKINNLQVGVGDRLAKVISELGEPMDLAYFEGSSYVSYENVSFMLDKVIEKTSDEATVFGIVVSEGYEIYGTKVGMTPDEIKSILGAADQEYKDGEGDEVMWKMEYSCGDYNLTFFFDDNKSPSTSAYLSKL
jgi:hypothetical protein